MRTVSEQTFKGACASIAEALAASGWHDAPDIGPSEAPGDQQAQLTHRGLAARWEQDTSGRLHCIRTAVPASASRNLTPTAVDRAAHVQAMGVSR